MVNLPKSTNINKGFPKAISYAAGKPRIPTGKVKVPSRKPSSSGMPRQAGSRPHKYVKRTGSPGNYKYWYKLPNGKLGTKKDLNQTKQQGQKVPSEAKTKIPKESAKGMPKQGKQNVIQNVSNKIKNAFGVIGKKIRQAKEANDIKQTEKLLKQANELQGLLERFHEVTKTSPWEKVKTKHKYSKENINSLQSVGEAQALLDEAQKPGSVQSGSVINSIKRRLDVLLDVRSKEKEKENAKKYQDAIIKATSKESNVTTETIKAKNLNITPEIQNLNKKASASYLLYLINQDRKDNINPKMRSQFKSLDQYYAATSNTIKSAMKNIGITGGYRLDPKTGSISFTKNIDQNLDKLKKAAQKEGVNLHYSVSRDIIGNKPAAKVRFSNVNGYDIFTPMKTTAIDAANSIANKTKDGSSISYRTVGINPDGSPRLEALDGSNIGAVSRMVYADKGKGKTQMMEGNILASLEGNPNDTYKAVVIDPVGGAFSVLYARDAELSPDQKVYKDKLNNYIKDGRLKILSPQATLKENKLTNANFKNYFNEVLNVLNRDQAVQSARRGGLEKLADSKYKENAVDVHMDELDLLNKWVSKDKTLDKDFYTTTMGLINNDSRKNMMPITAYTQTPGGASKKLRGANWGSVMSLGSGSARRIASAHNIKGAADWVRKTPANGVIDIDPSGDYNIFNKPVVGKDVKEAFGKLRSE